MTSIHAQCRIHSDGQCHWNAGIGCCWGLLEYDSPFWRCCGWIWARALQQGCGFHCYSDCHHPCLPLHHLSRMPISYASGWNGRAEISPLPSLEWILGPTTVDRANRDGVVELFAPNFLCLCPGDHHGLRCRDFALRNVARATLLPAKPQNDPTVLHVESKK